MPPPEPAGEVSPPVLRSSRGSWLARTTAIAVVLATVTGVLVAPGLRGLARDNVVEISNRLAWTLGYFAAGLLAAGIVGGALELSRGARARNGWTAFAVSAAGLSLVLITRAVIGPLPPIMSVAVAVVTAAVVAAAGIEGVRASHTRAVGVLMLAMATSSVLRIIAWDLARRAGDAGNTTLYGVARGVATAGLGFEALGQMVAAAWLGTRSRFFGQVLSSAAIGLAWILTLSASYGATASARPWQVAAHIALASASGLPQPYGPNGLAVFLLAASILLAAVAASQPRQVVSVVAALALGLIGRGTFDVPMRALAATTGALWLMLAVTDERAMWRALIAQRGSRPSPGPRPRREVGQSEA
jgi:hypothetical protein